MTVKLSKRIEEMEAQLVTTKDALTATIEALEAAPEDEDAAAALTIQVEELTAEIKAAEKQIDAFKGAEKALAARAEPVETDPVNAPAVAPNLMKYKQPDAKPGDLMFKMAAAKVKAHVSKQHIEQALDTHYPKMPILKELNKRVYLKTAVDPAMTTVADWAGALVQDDVRGYIDSLKNMSVAAALASYATTLTFNGYNSITVPRRTPPAAGYTEPAWVAEGSVIPLTRYSFGSTQINRYKLACITTMTEEIAMQRSVADIEMILRDAMRDAYSEVLDTALLSSAAAVTGTRPAGLLNGVTPIGGTAGGGEDAVRTDILALVSEMTGKRLGSRMVLIMNQVDRLSATMMTSALSEYVFRNDLDSGNLSGIPVIYSNNVPLHTIILVDASYLTCVFDSPMFSVSDVATVTEANADGTAPTQADDGAGALGTAGEVPPDGGIRVAGSAGAAAAGFTARSLWQTYSLGIRMIAPTSWAVLYDGAVSAITDTSWT